MLQKAVLNLTFAALFILSLIIGLVAFLPLNVAAKHIQTIHPHVNIQSIKGSWLQGSLLLSWQQFNDVNLRWQLDLNHLWSGQLVGQVHIDQEVLKGSTQVSLPLSLFYNNTPATLRLSGGQFTLDIAQLSPYAPYPLPAINGQLTLFVEQLKLGVQKIVAQSGPFPIIDLQPPIRFSTTNVLVLDGLNIGHFSGQLSSSLNPLGYQLSITNPSKPLMLTGHSLLTPQKISSDYQVNPSQNTDPQLIKLLSLMGQKLKNGGYRFNTVYAI
tara:strand:- start:647 stop:1456 length:810 start_codon:yes stop_codon:yes gene_type:complete